MQAALRSEPLIGLQLLQIKQSLNDACPLPQARLDDFRFSADALERNVITSLFVVSFTRPFVKMSALRSR